MPTTLQLSWTASVQFGGSFLGLDRGYYDDEGLDITFGLGGPNVAGDAQTVSGAALMNISGGDGVARSNIEGAGLTIVGMQYQKSPGTLLSLAEKDLMTPESLIGTRIAVAGTDTPALDAFLRYNEIDKSQVELIPSQYDPAVLTADQADSIFCFYNDLPVALEVQGIEHSTMLLADFGYNPASQVYTVLTESLQGDTREQVLHLLRAEIRGWQDYRTDYAEAAAARRRAVPGRRPRPADPAGPGRGAARHHVQRRHRRERVRLVHRRGRRRQHGAVRRTSASPGRHRSCSTGRCSRRSSPTGRRSDDRPGHR